MYVSILPTYRNSNFTKIMKGYTFSQNYLARYFYCFCFLIYGFTPSRVTQKPWNSIWLWLKKYFTILYLFPLPFILYKVSSDFCTWYVHYLFVNIKRWYIYAPINSNYWNKSFIFYWIMYGGLLTPTGRHL